MPKPKPPYERIAFVASDGAEAQTALAKLVARYGNRAPQEANAIVALGGDGLMLQTLHRHMNDHVPIFGMNRGSVGFLMNDYREDCLMGLAKQRNLVDGVMNVNLAVAIGCAHEQRIDDSKLRSLESFG